MSVGTGTGVYAVALPAHPAGSRLFRFPGPGSLTADGRRPDVYRDVDFRLMQSGRGTYPSCFVEMVRRGSAGYASTLTAAAIAGERELNVDTVEADVGRAGKIAPGGAPGRLRTEIDVWDWAAVELSQKGVPAVAYRFWRVAVVAAGPLVDFLEQGGASLNCFAREIAEFDLFFGRTIGPAT